MSRRLERIGFQLPEQVRYNGTAGERAMAGSRTNSGAAMSGSAAPRR